jgi:two-component system, cell cycle response regulator DivK
MAVAPSPALSARGAVRRALIAEADPATLHRCRDVLETAGFEVDAVDSGVAALVAARKRLPDLILIALQLRDVPGREVIGWFRSDPALRATPIIALASDAEDEAASAATRPDASLRKPLSSGSIRRAIHELLG